MTGNGLCLLIKLPENHPFKCCFWAPGSWGSAYKWLVFLNGEIHTCSCRCAAFPPQNKAEGRQQEANNSSSRILSGVYVLVRMFFLASIFLISIFNFGLNFPIQTHFLLNVRFVCTTVHSLSSSLPSYLLLLVLFTSLTFALRHLSAADSSFYSKPLIVFQKTTHPPGYCL